MKRILTFILTLTLALSFCVNSFAAATTATASETQTGTSEAQTDTSKTQADTSEAQTDTSKVQAGASYGISNLSGAPDIVAESAVVMDANTGTILYGKEADTKRYPASITKVMTALLAVENCKMSDVITYSNAAVNGIEAGSSTAGINVGAKLTVEDSLYALMLVSANEAAAAIAEHISGSTTEFAKLMTKRAKELGCTNTQFKNPHGLPNEEHYTTAHDMAIIFDAALKNDVFRYVDSTAAYTIPATNKYGERNCTSTNQLINGARPYEGVYAGKTGHTANAGRTLVTAAYRDGMDLICVIMKSDNDNFYSDTETLLDHAFLKVQGNEQEVYAAADDSVMAQNDLASGLNVRQYPSTSAPRIASLMPGAAVHRIGTFGNWSQVETPNGVGYVSSQYLIFQDGTPVGTYEVVNTLTDDQKSAAPVLASQESDEAEVTSSEESVEATQPESQAQENESNEAETNAQNQQVTTAAAGPTIPHQTYRYQLTINNLTIVIIGVIFAIAIVVAILAVTLIRRRNKDDDDDVYEQEAGNDEEKEIVPTPISAQEKVQRAQKTAKEHVKQSAKEQEARKKAAKNKRPIEEAKEEAVPVQDTHTVWEPQEIEEAEWDNDPEQENAEDEGFVDESGEETLQEYEDEYQEEAYDDYDKYEEYSDEDDWGDEILEDDWDEE